MALINCPECAKEISDKAGACPHCGYPIIAFLEEKKVDAEQLEAEKERLERQKRQAQLEKCDTAAKVELYKSSIKNGKPAETPKWAVNIVISAVIALICGAITSSVTILILTLVLGVYAFFRSDYLAKSESRKRSSVDKFIYSWKGITSYVVFIVIIVVVQGAYSGYTADKEKEKSKLEQLEKSKKIFSQAKAIIDKIPNITDEEITSAKALLTNDTLKDTPEYNEAQKLLPQISKLVDEANKRHEQREKEKAQEARKAEKEKEEAGLTPKGKRLRAKYPYWSIDDVDSISRGKIRIGMTQEQVRTAWGRPYHINRTSGSYGVHEQWVMHEMGGSYVYFEDGICTTIQN